MVVTVVLDFGSHLIVFKVAICMHKLKYWFLLQVYPLTNTRILYFLLNDSLLICMMIVTRRTSSWMLNKGREHYLLSIQEGNLVLVVWSSIHSKQKILFNFSLICLFNIGNRLIRQLNVKYWNLKSFINFTMHDLTGTIFKRAKRLITFQVSM